MKKYKNPDGWSLEISEARFTLVGTVFALQWTNSGDPGAFFGEYLFSAENEPAEFAASLEVVKLIEPMEGKMLAGRKPCIWFENLADAKTALQLVNSTMLAFQANLPWPEWATTAYAQGWKPPKGWKPC